jgi:Fe-S-cluster containining protein
MRDGILLRAVKRVALWSFRVNVATQRALLRARSERPWTLGGACDRSGGCCEAPAISVGRVLGSLPAACRLFLAWQKRVNGFELVSAEPRSRVFTFRCSHFDRGTRTCDSYGSRPGMCRDYPRNLMWQPNPELLPACGYRAVPPNAAGLRAALDEAELTPQQREKLRKGLRLES